MSILHQHPWLANLLMIVIIVCGVALVIAIMANVVNAKHRRDRDGK